MSFSWLRQWILTYRPCAFAGFTFAATFLLFFVSPIRQVGDSKYTLLVSDSLLQHRSFALDRYIIPNLIPKSDAAPTSRTNLYQLEWQDGHLYYYMPPGSSVLSVPFVTVAKALGISVADATGNYSFKNEVRLQSFLASLLMATLAAFLFYSSHLLLSVGASFLIAIGSALGTQVWSTASRGLWAETWGMLFFGIVIYMLLACEVRGQRIRPTLLATLLAWSYFVRPTNSLAIAAITIYLIAFHRRLIFMYLLTGAAWLAVFLVYSWYHFAQLLPRYFEVGRLHYVTFWTALLGNLVSPSRGLLIYVPVLLFVAGLLGYYWRFLLYRRLVVLSLLVVIGHLIIISSFVPWYGGGCYGPRYSAGLVPWFALLATLSIRTEFDQRNEGRESKWRRKIAWVVGGILLAASIFVNARGAMSPETSQWNNVPVNVDVQPSKVWAWNYPQFLAGLIEPPRPASYPLLEDRINFLSPESGKYLWYGWSTAEERYRWSTQSKAGLVFGLENISGLQIRMKLAPFLVPGKVDRQRLDVIVNGHGIASFDCRKSELTVYTFVIPRQNLGSHNTIVLKLPDASSPELLGIGNDGRELGISLNGMETSRLDGAGH